MLPAEVVQVLVVCQDSRTKGLKIDKTSFMDAFE